MTWIRTAAAFAVVVLTACAVDHDPHFHGDDLVGDAFERAWLEASDEKADVAGCSGVRVPDRGPFGMRIALTFDDGPNPNTTPSILETLRRHGAPATFFINGNRVVDDATRAIATEVVNDPLFELANHSWSHPDFSRLTDEDVQRQIDDTTTVISDAGGAPRFFRFPFGSSTCETADAARARDYRIAGWHVDSADWCFGAHDGVCPERVFAHVPDAHRRDMVGFVMAQVTEREGGILLFHDIHRYTADSLEVIIETLVATGFEIVPLEDVRTFPRLNGQTPPIVGDACERHADCDLATGAFCHASGFCTVRCTGYCDDAIARSTFCIRDGEGDAGICVVKAATPDACEAIPNTRAAMTPRHVGRSGASAISAQVCAPR